MYGGLKFGLSRLTRHCNVCRLLTTSISFSRSISSVVSASTSVTDARFSGSATSLCNLQCTTPLTFHWKQSDDCPDSAAWKFRQKCSVWSLTQTRPHWRPLRSQRTPFTKPVNFDYSGDLDLSIGEIDMREPKLGFEDVPELLEADENIKKIFSLEYATHADVIQKHVDNLLKKVKDHPLDIRSLEVKIAKETIRIRFAIKHCLHFRNDKVSKGKLIELIHKRQSHLRRLMRDDIDKFNWLQRELRIKFMEDFRPRKLSKADKRKQAAENAAIAAVEAKVEALRKALDEERVKFDEYKEVELADIERGMRELGVSDDAMTSLEGALTALGHAELMPRPKPVVSRGRQILERQLELYMPRKRTEDAEILRAHGFLTPDEFSHYPEAAKS